MDPWRNYDNWKTTDPRLEEPEPEEGYCWEDEVAAAEEKLEEYRERKRMEEADGWRWSS